MKKHFSIKSRIKSFKFAFRGIWLVISSQHNAWIHMVMAVAAIVLSFALKINPCEWIAIVLSIVIVLAAEAINTALENLTDLVSPEINSKAGKVKDIAAGAVLIAAMGALAAGLIIFIPKLF